ncbi:uncharacterized protein LOC106163281 [Lingula anatina]|uniref:Uncharacterized protein LOC106163281 n=1 Tax=Lingula anatina TaxID=7574 RepID=A0A1S3IDD6_LINAN|nr:uncharacterized protein LOC106163281 [Lingula anatina]XP_013396275.1 uncharacterized protein LOC106163281 [Lingula anatina]XP_013396276.1 uncharacterized protein LOC106163281 [Lingula anatina]|eukprot:XP_013396274.1 uncharacterized protein LOC106163281 [Lingula anatina]
MKKATVYDSSSISEDETPPDDKGHIKCECGAFISHATEIINGDDSIQQGFSAKKQYRLFGKPVKTWGFKNPSNYLHVIVRVKSATVDWDNQEVLDTYPWFKGYSWSIAYCKDCRQFLGWKFIKGQQYFFGLVIKKLQGPHQEAAIWCAECNILLAKAMHLQERNVTRRKGERDSSERIAIAGVHGMRLERVSNPGEYYFLIVPVSECINYRAAGGKTSYYTWYKGYEWEIIYCSGCGNHIGWKYTNRKPSDTFYGLIRDRLGGLDSDPPELSLGPSAETEWYHEKRLALVVGNNYSSDPARRLPSCHNDADEMCKVLRSLNLPFKVTVLKDANEKDIMDVIKGWGRQTDAVVLFYFSGHGEISKDGVAQLLCHNGDKIDEDKLLLSLGKTEAAFKIYITDACRGQTAGGKSALMSMQYASQKRIAHLKELNETDRGYDMVKILSTSDGTNAYAGSNVSLSPFTQCLVDEIPVVQEIYDLCLHVQSKLSEKHNHQIAQFVFKTKKKFYFQTAKSNHSSRSSVSSEPCDRPLLSPKEYDPLIKLFEELLKGHTMQF